MAERSGRSLSKDDLGYLLEWAEDFYTIPECKNCEILQGFLTRLKLDTRSKEIEDKVNLLILPRKEVHPCSILRLYPSPYLGCYCYVVNLFKYLEEGSRKFMQKGSTMVTPERFDA